MRQRKKQPGALEEAGRGESDNVVDTADSGKNVIFNFEMNHFHAVVRNGSKLE